VVNCPELQDPKANAAHRLQAFLHGNNFTHAFVMEPHHDFPPYPPTRPEDFDAVWQPEYRPTVKRSGHSSRISDHYTENLPYGCTWSASLWATFAEAQRKGVVRTYTHVPVWWVPPDKDAHRQKTLSLYTLFKSHHCAAFADGAGKIAKGMGATINYNKTDMESVHQCVAACERPRKVTTEGQAQKARCVLGVIPAMAKKLIQYTTMRRT
jgi:hypothetical protein